MVITDNVVIDDRLVLREQLEAAVTFCIPVKSLAIKAVRILDIFIGKNFLSVLL